MTSQSYSEGILGDLRVLELADEKGQWCGKLMADMGADVIKIEPPGGAPERRIGPFYQDQPHPERSLYFWHYNSSKRGITLDIEKDTGRDVLRSLVATADIVLETFPPGYLSSLGLGYEQLRSINPSIIMCSLTPFGQNGPWAQYQTADILQMAAGGQMAMCGYDEEDVPDAPPIAPGGGNAWHIGSHFAFIAIGAALYQRHMTGQGQHLDVSIHECCSLNTQQSISAYRANGETLQRHTGGQASAGSRQTSQSMGKDGKFLNRQALGVRTPPDRLRALAEWMNTYGMADDLLEEKYLDPKVIADRSEHLNDVLQRCLAAVTAEEAYHGGQKARYPWGEVRTVEEILTDPHWDDRGLWQEVEHPELGQRLKYPVAYALFSATPISISRRAPLIGEHNEEILCGELGMSRAEMSVLAEFGVV